MPDDNNRLTPEHAARLAEALAAYELLLDNCLTARRYYAGERTEHEGVRVWGDIIERAAARAREEQQDT
jgi:hypothetical protein